MFCVPPKQSPRSVVVRRLTQQIFVENRPGANGTVGTSAGARAEPDGYSFVMLLAAHAANPSLYKICRTSLRIWCRSATVPICLCSFL